LGDEQTGYVFYNGMKTWLATHSGAFSDDAKIDLEACGTANPNTKGKRVADAFKKALPGATVHGFTGLAARRLFGSGYVGMPNNFITAGYEYRYRAYPNVPADSKWVEVK
jgi:hypothetical protein